MEDIDPLNFKEDQLLDYSIVDDTIKIIREKTRIGGLGTKIHFSNDDFLSLEPSTIEIHSLKFERLSLFYNYLSSCYKIKEKKSKFNTDYHLIDSENPAKVFDKLYEKSEFSLKAIQLVRSGIEFTIFNCSPNTVHVRALIEFSHGERMHSLFETSSKLDRVIESFDILIKKIQ